MASNFDRFMADILGPISPHIQQATQGMDPRLAGQIIQQAVADGMQAAPQPTPQAQPQIPVQTWNPSVPTTPQQVQTAPMQGPVPNPNAEYRPPSDPQEMTEPGPQTPMPQVGRTTEDYVPEGTPLSPDENFILVEIMVPNPNLPPEQAATMPLVSQQVMVPEHYLAGDTPANIRVMSEPMPGTNIPDEFKLENQPDEIRWMFEDERTEALTEQRNTPGSQAAMEEQRAFDSEPTGAALTDEQAYQRAAAAQGAGPVQGPDAPPEPQTYSVEEIADPVLRNQLIEAGYQEVREDHIPLTNPDTGKITLVTEQEIIDQNLPIPVEWVFEDEAYIQQLKDAGIEYIRADQMIVMDNGALKAVKAPETSNRERPGQPLPPVTPDYLEQYDPAIAAEMRSANITEIPDNMVLTRREDGRLAVLPTSSVDVDDIIFYGGQSNRPDPGLIHDSDGSLNLMGGARDLLGTAISGGTGLLNMGLGVLGGMTGRDMELSEESVAGVLEAFDASRVWNVDTMGEEAYNRATGNRGGQLPTASEIAGWTIRHLTPEGVAWADTLEQNAVIPTVDFEVWVQENPEQVIAAYENGYDFDNDGEADFTGGRAVWELYAATQPGWQRAIGEVGLDPLNALPFGAGSATNLGRRLMVSGHPVLGRITLAGGRALTIADELPGRILGAPVRAVTNQPVRATNVNARPGDARVPVGLESDPGLARGEFTGPVGRRLNPSEQTRLENEVNPIGTITRNTVGDARRTNAQGIGFTDEPLPPGAMPGGGPETPPPAPGPNAPSQQAVQQEIPVQRMEQDTSPVTRPEDEQAARDMTPEQRDETIRTADDAEPSQPTTIDTNGPDVPPDGPPLPPDAGDGIPSPGPRDWGNFAPQEGGDYLISRLWAARNEYPARWRSFYEDVNQRLREYNDRRHISNQRSRELREAREADRQARLARGEDVSNLPVRDFEGAALDAVDDAEVLIDVYEAAQRSYGDVADIRHTFSSTYRTDPSRVGKDRRYFGQQDNYYVERAIFGTGRQSAAAFEQLRYKAMEQNNTALMSELPRIQRLRKEWEGLKTRPLTPEADAGNVVATMMPRERLRTTVDMTDEQLQAVGLPARLQPRQTPYSRLTVDRIMREGYQMDRAPIIVKQGTDGNHYIVSGHSRYEAANRLDVPEVPVSVTTREGQDLLDLARSENESVTGFTPRERAQQVRQDVEGQGRTVREVAESSNRGNEFTGDIGTSEARRDYMISHIPGEAAGLWDLIDQGVVGRDVAELIGAGFRGEHLPLSDANRIATNVSLGRWSVPNVRAAIARVIKRNEKPTQRGFGLFDEGMDGIADSPLDGAMNAIEDAATQRSDLISQYNKIFREAGQKDTRRFNIDRLSPEDQARARDLEAQIRPLADEMGILPDEALKATAIPRAEIPTDGTPGVDPDLKRPPEGMFDQNVYFMRDPKREARELVAKHRETVRRVFSRDEPPVPQGYTRLYRGESIGPARKVSPWIATDPRWQEQQAAKGRWFSPAREEAEWYITENGGPEGGRLVYVDIPSEEVAQYAVRGSEVERFSMNPDMEVFVSPDIAARRRPLNADIAYMERGTGLRIEDDPNFGMMPDDAQGIGIVRDPRREAQRAADWTGNTRLGQKVKAIFDDMALDPEAKRTRSMLATHDELTTFRRTFMSEDFGVIHGHDELVTLGRRIGSEPDAPTALDLWERYYREELGDTRTQTGVFDEGDAPSSVKIEALDRASYRMVQDVYADALRRVNPEKYAIYRNTLDERMAKTPDADPNVAHIEALRAANEDASKVPQGYDTYLAIQREIRLYNPITGVRYITTQAVGNVITAMLGTSLARGAEIAGGILGEGTRDILSARTGRAARGTLADLRGQKSLGDFYAPLDSPADIRRIAMEEEAATPGITLDDVDRGMISYGVIDNPTVIRRAREDVMGLETSAELAQETILRRTMEKYRWTKPIKKASGLLANPHIREFANIFDLTARKVTFMQRMDMNAAAVKPRFFEHAREALPDGADLARFDELVATMPRRFDDAYVRAQFGEFGGGYAERMGRDWRSTIRNMERDANAEVNRLFFSGQELEGDAALRRIIMFHYWMSRATPLYTASLMKHVGLMTTFAEMMMEVKEQSGEYGRAVSGMLNVFDSIFGYNLFIRPDGLLQTIFSFGNDAGFVSDDANPIWRFLSNSGLMFNPMIMSIANFAGMGGDTFAPDPFSLQTHAAFATMGIDLFKSVTGFGGNTPTRNQYQEMMARFRAETSDWVGQEVPFARSDQFALVEINNLIYDIAEERGLDWSNPEDQAYIIASMNDPESELYGAAFDRYARANFTQTALRVAPTSVVYPKIRSSGKDERALTIRTTERSDPANQQARDQRDYAQVTDPDVRQLRVQQDEYQRLGTDEQRDAYSTYNAIRFGPLQVSVVYNGVAISERQLRTMDDDQRKAVADQWAEQSGVAEDIEAIREERKAYRETHPTYARYYDWSLTVGNAEGGAQAHWENVLIPNNPNAARYYESLEEMPTADLERELTSVQAFFAAEGMRPTGYDPDPISTGIGNPATMVGDLGLGQGYGTYEPVDPATRIREDLAEYYSQADAVDARIKEIYGPEASLAKIMDAPPTWRDGYLARLEREGVEVPKLSRASQDYIAWAEAQNPGADVSVDAYIAWKEANEPEVTVSGEDAEQRILTGIGR